MPAQIVIVHDDRAFVEKAGAALRQAGYQVATFTDSMVALKALESARIAELLVTRDNFPGNVPNGISLALMARRLRPEIKVLFAVSPENEPYTEGVGDVLPPPVTVPKLVEAVRRVLGSALPTPPP